MLVNGDPLPQDSVPGWSGECSNFQWTPVQNICDYNACNVIGDYSNQRYQADYYVRDPGIQYFCPTVNNVQPSVPINVCYPQKPAPQFMQALPCRQSQEWDYDSMCYNVGGEPCQFTSVVDLEDFM
ncbi:unnamed protein product [Pieris macdunnoughi]|uniref:Uncharacterized protein n=1 Tax=Pieris macdunnoughi TaxID=345717 RepID=A0A821P2Y2_9NEOP|nr:unnamed protein product [Pieris macdunnoughi]